MEGTVKWFSDKKGFGFVTGGDGRDYFVHFSSIADTGKKYKSLREGAAVMFETGESDKGLVAQNVVVVETKKQA